MLFILLCFILFFDWIFCFFYLLFLFGFVCLFVSFLFIWFLFVCMFFNNCVDRVKKKWFCPWNYARDINSYISIHYILLTNYSGNPTKSVDEVLYTKQKLYLSCNICHVCGCSFWNCIIVPCFDVSHLYINGAICQHFKFCV